MTDDDSIDHIPPIVPARDEVVARSQSAAKKTGQKPGNTKIAAGAGMLARLFITLSLVVAAVAWAWAWQLQQQLTEAESVLQDHGARIADLEARLSDTDEGVNQSSAAMAVKIKKLYSEVDKLWASAWRTNKAKIAKLETASANHGRQLSTLDKTDKNYAAQLKSLAADMVKLEAVSGELEQLVKTAKASEAQLEKLGDDLSRMGLEYAKLQKRVGANEERFEPIDGFRKQVNETLLKLEKRLKELQFSSQSPTI